MKKKRSRVSLFVEGEVGDKKANVKGGRRDRFTAGPKRKVDDENDQKVPKKGCPKMRCAQRGCAGEGGRVTSKEP